MNSLFGVELPTAVNFVIAFVVVLLLIGLTAWLVRRFGAARLDASARGRQPRLAVIDSAAVDGRRKLVIIRRDNVEHLLMVGGPTDVVVETNIVRAAQGVREPVARNGADVAVRPAAMPEPATWQPEPMPAPAPMPAPTPPAAHSPPLHTPPMHNPPMHSPRIERGPRIVAEDPAHWQAPEPTVAPPVPPPLRAIRSADTLAGLADELARPEARAEAPVPLRAVPLETHAPPVAPPTPSQQPSAAASDQSLAEMAQRLEAALRRPAAPKPAEGGAPRVAVAADGKPAARAAAAAPKPGAQPRPQPTNLEKEMASLLGRTGKT